MVIKQSQEFEVVVRAVFGRLLESFPVPVRLDAAVAGYEVAANEPVECSGFSESAEHKPSNDEFQFASSVRWLAAEGYIRINQEYYTCFDGVTLTEKGLAVLSATPPCLGKAFYA